MKAHRLVATFCASFTLTGAVLAANPSTKSSANLVDAAKLDGKQVKNQQGENLGEIQQVLIDPQSGRVRYAVVQVDKAWNFNDPEVAVPWGAFQVSGKPEDNNFRITLDATKQKLESAPKFKAGEADRLYSMQSAQPVYSYWAILWVDDTPSSNQGKSGTGTTGSGTTGTGTTGSGTTGTGTTGSGTSGTGTSGSGTSGSGTSGSGGGSQQPNR